MSYLPRNSAQVTSGNLLFAGQAPGWRVVSTPTEMGQQGGPRVSDGGFIDAEHQGWLPWQVVEGVDRVWTSWKGGRIQ